MGTYFNGNSEIQGGGGGDGLQTLILMNHLPPPPAYVGYSSDTQSPPPHSNFVFLNSNAAANFPHAPPPPSHTQHFVGIPLTSTADTHSQSIHDISALHGYPPRMQYNIYNPVDLAAARDATRSQQGLSLSLSSQQTGYGTYRVERDAPAPAISPASRDEIRVAGGGSSSSASGISHAGVTGMQSVLVGSKYLKVAQELLEEVVNVGKGVKITSGTRGAGGSPAATAGDGGSGGETSTKRDGAELTTAERQEIQMKKAKLVNMLDEVKFALQVRA